MGRCPRFYVPRFRALIGPISNTLDPSPDTRRSRPASFLPLCPADVPYLLRDQQ